MIYDYITTKPPLDEDTLAHYGIKGMKWKNHIYAVKKALTNGYGQARNRVLTMLPQLQNGLNAGVSTARKKAKGSYYKKKSKAQELGAKVNRKIRKINPTIRSTDDGKTIIPSRDTGKVGYNPMGNGTYLFSYQRNKKIHKRNLDAGISAGRKRVAKKRR